VGGIIGRFRKRNKGGTIFFFSTTTMIIWSSSRPNDDDDDDDNNTENMRPLRASHFQGKKPFGREEDEEKTVFFFP